MNSFIFNFELYLIQKALSSNEVYEEMSRNGPLGQQCNIVRSQIYQEMDQFKTSGITDFDTAIEWLEYKIIIFDRIISINYLLSKLFQTIKINISPYKMLHSVDRTLNFEKENHNPFKANNKSKSMSTVRQLLTEMDLSTKKRKHSHRKPEPCLDRQQIRKQMKQKWKDPGYCNLEFSHHKALKGRFLNEWELQRICLANRSYQYPKDFKGFRQCSQSKQFPKVTKQMYSQKFQKYISSMEEKNENQMFNHKKLGTQVSTATFRDSRFVRTKHKQIFQSFIPQNKQFGMGTVVWKKGQTARKLKTLDY